MRRGQRLFRPVRCYYRSLSLNYQREKKASGEALIVISEARQPLKNVRLILRTSQMTHDANTPDANPIKLLLLSMNNHADIARLNAGQIRIANTSAAHFGRVNNVITVSPSAALGLKYLCSLSHTLGILAHLS